MFKARGLLDTRFALVLVNLSIVLAVWMIKALSGCCPSRKKNQPWWMVHPAHV
jgi:hypothetical protein